MKFTNIERSMNVTAIFERQDASLDLHRSMEGAKEVEEAFFNALKESLRSPAPIPCHIKVATEVAEVEAQIWGYSLAEYGFEDSEPQLVIDKVMNELSLVKGVY